MYMLLDKSQKIVDLQARPFTVAAPYVWEAVPDGMTPIHGLLFIDGALVNPLYPTLDAARLFQKKALGEMCRAQIIGGFSSGATGSLLFYASTNIDQRNMAQRAQSDGGLLACQNAAGVWARLEHTQVQAQAVLRDFVKFCDGLRAELTELEAQIDAATTIEQVMALCFAPG